MKKFVKIVTVNDGKGEKVGEGYRLSVETYPRMETLIETFLARGWTLEHMLKRYNPSIQKPGVHTFYLGGWDLVFMKETEDGKNDGNEVLREALSRILEPED